MIGCDGDCDDWYHGKCVNMHPRDAELIDRYICKPPFTPSTV
jgi:COMPASS component SPP1